MKRDWLAAIWIVFCLALAYGNDMGRGFVADDFSWIYFSRIHTPADLTRPFVLTPMGFYRPLVSLSFSLDHAVYGMWAMGYALTNFLIAVVIFAGIIAIVRGLGWSTAEALFAGALWLFNMHGIGMALTWASGRTSLLTTMWAVLAGVSVTRRSRIGAGAFTLCALLSKEEPVMLPVILGLWLVIDPESGSRIADRVRAALRLTWPAWLALGIYLALRLRTDAFTPSTAPEVYALSLSPRIVLPNIPEYADRSMTFVAAILLLGFLLFGRRQIAFDPAERLMALRGAVWLVLGFAATILVPVRSDLYACFPSVGSALIGVAGGRALWRSVPLPRRRAAIVALCLLPLPLLPIYWARNAFARRDATIAADALADITSSLQRAPDVTRIEVVENPNEVPSISNSFRGTLGRAIELTIGRTVNVQVKDTTVAPPPVEGPGPHALRFVFAQGKKFTIHN